MAWSGKRPAHGDQPGAMPRNSGVDWTSISARCPAPATDRWMGCLLGGAAGGGGKFCNGSNQRVLMVDLKRIEQLYGISLIRRGLSSNGGPGFHNMEARLFYFWI